MNRYERAVSEGRVPSFRSERIGLEVRYNELLDGEWFVHPAPGGDPDRVFRRNGSRDPGQRGSTLDVNGFEYTTFANSLCRIVEGPK